MKITKILFLLSLSCFIMRGQSQDFGFDLQESEKLAINMISVTVGGNFPVNGSFTALRTQRVDHFLTKIFLEAKQQAVQMTNQMAYTIQALKQVEKYPKRNILLKHADGTQEIIDLEKFRITGDFKYNPYLKNDDVLIFPENNIETNFVDISGAVNKPVKFIFCEGDKLSDAILFAHGLNPAYDNIVQVEISRLTENGTKENTSIVDIAEDPILERGDRIKVLSDENHKKDYKVLVLGEVKNPGYVYITKNNSSIKEVINKCGGFNENADLRRSELIRGADKAQLLAMNSLKKKFEDKDDISSILIANSINELSIEKLKMSRMADISMDDTSSFSIDNTLRILSTSGIIDFQQVLSDSSSAGNYLVNDGDVIIIPQVENLVYLYGQVGKPGYTPYKKGADYNYYVSKAGGLGENVNEIYIIRGDSREWLTAEEETIIYPGDYIYAQKEFQKSSSSALLEISSYGSVIGAVATLTLVIYQILKRDK